MVEPIYTECPKCGARIQIPKRTAFKAKCAAGGAIGGMAAGATAGAIIGTGMGIASGGTAAAGTIPVGIVGGVIGGLTLGIAGNLGADWAIARVSCPEATCGETFRIQSSPGTAGMGRSGKLSN